MKVLAQNKGVFYHYKVVRKIEAGIKLFGYEVKSIKRSHVSLKESYVRIRNGQAWIIGMSVSRWPYVSRTIPVDPVRDRILLLNKNEILKITMEQKKESLTVVPIKLYLKNNLIKLEIGVAKGIKKYEKREKIKLKEYKREIQKRNKRRLL